MGPAGYRGSATPEPLFRFRFPFPFPFLFLLPLLFLFLVRPLAAQKTDTLYIRNGDRIIGEIKGMSKARLEYSTDDLGTLYVEWTAVDRLISPESFEVELESGFKYYGRLDAAPPLSLVIGGMTVDTIGLPLVVRITPMKKRFVSRLDGYLDLGFTYQKVNHTLQLTLGNQVKYRGPKIESILESSLFLQNQDSVDLTTRSSADFTQRVFLRNRWSAGGALAFEQNRELDLQSRIKLTGTVGRALVQSNVVDLLVGGGLVLGRERFYNTTTTTTTVEAVFGGEFEAFRYNHPKLDLNTTLFIYPSLSDWGRVRLDADSRVSYELIKDFFLTFSFFDSFDSRPPSEVAAKNDFGTTLSISWSF